MKTLCVHCAMRALLKHEQPPFFEETPQAHVARLHPDAATMMAERRELEQEYFKVCEQQLAAALIESFGEDGEQVWGTIQ